MSKEFTINVVGFERAFCQVTEDDYDLLTEGDTKNLFHVESIGIFDFIQGTDANGQKHYIIAYGKPGNNDETGLPEYFDPDAFFTTDAKTYLDLVTMWIVKDDFDDEDNATYDSETEEMRTLSEVVLALFHHTPSTIA